MKLIKICLVLLSLLAWSSPPLRAQQPAAIDNEAQLLQAARELKKKTWYESIYPEFNES